MFDRVLNANLDSVAFLRGFKSGTIKLKPFFYGNKKHFIESGEDGVNYHDKANMIILY